MPPLVRLAVVLMFAALIAYSMGVWLVVLTRQLKPWHAGLFWSGFIFDTSGTDLMRRLVGRFEFNLHSATGALALLLMLAHAVWATAVLARRDQRAARTFHRLSIVVWTIWLIPFVTGLVLGRHAGARLAR